MRTFSRSLVLLIALAVVVAACGDDGSVLLGDPEVTSASTTVPSETTTPESETTAAPSVTEAPPETTEAPPETTEAPPETAPPPPPIPVVTPSLSEESYDEPPLEIEVTLPVVSGIPAPAAAAINTAIGDAVLGYPTAFRDEILGGDPLPDDIGTTSEMVLGYTATAVNADVLSLRYNLYAYYQGAAHGMSAIFTTTFDPQTGALLDLADVLIPGTAPAVAALVEQHLIDDLYGGNVADASAWLPPIDPPLLDSWVVSADGLEFSFDQYEVGFGAMGSPTVIVPWSELTAVIDPAGPAAGFAFG